MTDPFAQPYQFPGAARPEKPRPKLGRIIGWVALVLGGLILLGSLIDFSIAGLALGLCMAAAGGLYVFSKPSRGRLVWATPAVAMLPALVAFGIMTPAPESEEVPRSTAFAAPAVAKVSTTTSSLRTTTAAPTTTTPPPTTTVAPTPETVTVYAPPPVPSTTQYVPAPAPVYVAEPEPVYVPPAPVPFVAAAPAAPSSVYYANCDAVRAAGAAPIYAGDPGYSTKLDRDKDGVGCEN